MENTSWTLILPHSQRIYIFPLNYQSVQILTSYRNVWFWWETQWILFLPTLNLLFWFRTSFRGIKSDVFGMYKPEMHNYFHQSPQRLQRSIFDIPTNPRNMDNMDIHGCYTEKRWHFKQNKFTVESNFHHILIMWVWLSSNTQMSCDL